jgi:hypothetical protein
MQSPAQGVFIYILAMHIEPVAMRKKWERDRPSYPKVPT